jgi:putative ABC transport system substrate-binding protein
MKRRALVLASGAWVVLAAARAFGQAAGTPRLIGWLSPMAQETQKPLYDIFFAKLRELGHVEGRGIRIEGRWAGGDSARLDELGKELLKQKPAVILTMGTAAVAALQRETTTVPVVFASGGDPVASGFVASLARPGGNITGVMLRWEVNEKLMELVRETVPTVSRIAMLTDRGDPIAARVEKAYADGAKKLRYELSVVDARRPEEFERAFADAKGKAQAIMAPPLSLFYVHQQRIAQLALAMKLPLFTSMDRTAVLGALLSYTNDVAENYRRAAVLVDKILRGARPADLPVEQPDRYRLVVNNRTARALGVKIPPSVLLRADEVIE